MRLIDADAFAKKAYDVAYPVVHGWNDHERGLTLFGIAELLDEMPVVEAVPVIHAKLINPQPYGECSICGTLIDIRDEFNYCPHCGAKLDLKEE